MLSVLFIWCYIFVSCLSLGFLFGRWLRLKIGDWFSTLLIGLFTVTLLASTWAIFGRIDIEFHLFLVLSSLLIFLKWASEIKALYLSFFKSLKQLSKLAKLFSVFVTILFTAVCAAPSFFADNEIYYIQTIKWLNEYGFVKGLANLHLFFGQTSGWHILQSVFNLSFLGIGTNCLNGFLILVGNLQAISQFRSNSFMRFFALANVLLFPFVAIPSPDLAVCTLSFVAFSYAIDKEQNFESQQLNYLFLLSVFVTFIKITAAPILLLPFSLYILHRKKFTFRIGVFAIGLFTFGLFIIKNSILTGLPLYPLQAFKIVGSDFALPDAIYEFSFNQARLYDFVVAKNVYVSLSAFELFVAWLRANIFNSMMVLLLLIVPLFIKRCYPQKTAWILYGIMVIQLIILLVTSPQYRFLLHFILFFGMLIGTCIIRMDNYKTPLLYLSLVPLMLVFFYPKALIRSKAIVFRQENFSFENIIFPYGDSNLKTSYNLLKVGNLSYYSPDTNTYIWATGNGKLPCVNQKQIQYFEYKLGYSPQLRTNTLEDGFYSKKVSQ